MYALMGEDWGAWMLYGRLDGVLVGRYGLPELLAIAHERQSHIFLLWLRA